MIKRIEIDADERLDAQIILVRNQGYFKLCTYSEFLFDLSPASL